MNKNKTEMHMIKMFLILACCFILGISINISDVYAKETYTKGELTLLTDEQYHEGINYQTDKKILKKDSEKSDVNPKMISIIDKMKGEPNFLDKLQRILRLHGFGIFLMQMATV